MTTQRQEPVPICWIALPGKGTCPRSGGYVTLRAATVVLVFVLASVAAGGAIGASAAESKIDWTPWKALPVYDDGREMPLDSFARSAVEVICHRQKPEFDPQATLSAEEFRAAERAGIGTLFPGGKPRRFEAAELLLGWIMEPEKWELVPFLIAEHDGLRKYLHLPLVGPQGQKLKYVSPAQIKASDAFQVKLMELRDRQRAAESEGTEPQLDDVDTKFTELVRAIELHQQLVFHSVLDGAARRNLATRMMTVESLWSKMGAGLGILEQTDQGGEAKTPVERARESFARLSELNGVDFVAFADVEPAAVQFAAATGVISRHFAGLRQRLDDKPPDVNPEQLRSLRTTLGELALHAERLHAEADRLVESLYDNAETLCVVPALRAAALERDRDTMDSAEPWLDLQTLVTAPAEALAGYPQDLLRDSRTAFERLRRAYAERSASPANLESALADFAGAVRKLGEAINPLRDGLPIANRDDEMIAYTAYPAAGYTSTELRYNETNPFFASWIISLAAFLAFGLFVIGFRSKMLYGIGISILIAGLIWAIYGFSMRVKISGWAPVTNMYETMIFVPFVVSLLGAWFALLPVLWPGLQNAWRMTAFPGTWEAAPLTVQQSALFRPATWSLANWLLLLPRIVLGLFLGWLAAWAPYAAGGRTIINLLPNVDAGQSWPDINDWITWGTGLCVLAPSVWYLPRMILSAVLGLALVPASARGQMRALGPQVMRRWPFALAATFTAFLGACIAWYSPVLTKGFSPLQPVLRDNFWLLIHVLTIVASYGAGALAWGVGNVGLLYYAFGRYRAPSFAVATTSGHRIAGGQQAHEVELGNHPPEACAELAGYVYKAIQVAVVLLAAGTILGALWADVAWGRFWGWDPKEVWALISLLVYIAILHARYAGLVGNFGLCVGSVLGASAIVMSWYGVNFVLGVGLHSYGFGAGGQWYVLGGGLLNWALVAVASLRYAKETMLVPAGR